MCPELSHDQSVCQDYLSRAFYPETFTCDKFDQQHTFFLNHGPSRAPQYKLPDEYGHDDIEGSSAGTPRSPLGTALGEHLQPSHVISMGMIDSSHCGQEPYPPLSPGAAETSADYSLHMSCSDNQLMPEIVDCGWMKDVLDDFLLCSHEMPPLAPLSIGHYSAINLPSLLLPLDLTSKQELPANPPAAHPPLEASSQIVTSPGDAMETCEYVSAPAPAPKSPAKAKSSSSSSPTPEPLKTRASKRLQRDEGPRKVSKWSQNANLANVDQIEHVIRERQRRDDMSYKIATLEGLLPQGPKRDRASVVHDSVQYVKLLQQRVEELTKKSAEMLQLKRSSKASSPVIVRKENVIARAAEESEKLFRLVNFHVQVEGGDDAVTVSNCRCSVDFLSLTMKALEQLQLDLCRSSITKMPDGTFFCVIASKSRLEDSAVPSSSTLALKIKSAVEMQV